MICTFENNSIENYQEMLKHIQIKDLKVLQLSNGVYKDKTSIFFLPNLRLSMHNKNDCTLLRMGTLSEERFVISLSLEGAPHYVNGSILHLDGINIIGPGEYIYTRTESALKVVTLSISKKYLIHYLGAEYVAKLISELTLIRAGKIIFWEIQHIKKMIYMYVVQLFNCKGEFTRQALFDIEQNILMMLCQLLALSRKQSKKKSYFNNRLEIVQKSISYIDSRSDINIPIPSILHYSHCSMRTLGYAFQSVLGVSPQRYLKIRRMHLIRNELMQRKNVFIKDIVSKYGIVNVGRFSQDFYQLFGKYPKEI